MSNYSEPSFNTPITPIPEQPKDNKTRNIIIAVVAVVVVMCCCCVVLGALAWQYGDLVVEALGAY